MQQEILNKQSQILLDKARKENIETVFDRAKLQKGCPFGEKGNCCRHCNLGPCRFTNKNPKGVCGIDKEIVGLRNFVRAVAAGTSAHSDHSYGVVELLDEVVKHGGKWEGFEIKGDDVRIDRLAKIYGASHIDKLNMQAIVENKIEVVKDIVEAAKGQFNTRKPLFNLIRAPLKRQKLWENIGIQPRGIDIEIREALHRTTVGTDQEIESLGKAAYRCALADGFGGCMISTDLQDILLGTPVPLRAKANLGVFKENMVNIVIHGHEPLLPEVMVSLSKDPEYIKKAKEKGADGISILGICCTANEILMRHGIPLAGNYLDQELALLTGVVEVMAVDIQCIFPSLVDVSGCYHTKIITTTKKAKIQGAMAIEFEENPMRAAREIMELAISNFGKRIKEKIMLLPDKEVDLVAGFSHETINYILGGRFRGSYRPLNNAIIDGRIKGIVGMAGCNNTKVVSEAFHVELVKALTAENILTLHTGCSAMTLAKAGMLNPEASVNAGAGLQEICEAVGIPPSLHCGACVDNSRLLDAASAMVNEGGLGEDISDLPIVGIAPEWMSEKALAIGNYFVASGLNVIFGVSFPMDFESKGWKFLTDESLTGGRWYCVKDLDEMIALTIDIIEKKREKLGIKTRPPRVLYDMEMRRELKF